MAKNPNEANRALIDRMRNWLITERAKTLVGNQALDYAEKGAKRKEAYQKTWDDVSRFYEQHYKDNTRKGYERFETHLNTWCLYLQKLSAHINAHSTETFKDALLIAYNAAERQLKNREPVELPAIQVGVDMDKDGKLTQFTASHSDNTPLVPAVDGFPGEQAELEAIFQSWLEARGWEKGADNKVIDKSSRSPVDTDHFRTALREPRNGLAAYLRHTLPSVGFSVAPFPEPAPGPRPRP